MKKLLFGAILASGVAFAVERPSHMVSFTNQGLGWSGSVEKMETQNTSSFDNLQEIKNNFAFNYAYRITDQQQLGIQLQVSNSETKFRHRSGSESPSERELTTFGFFAIHNFKEDLNRSFYLGLGVSFTNVEEEISHDFADSEGKSPIETDDNIVNYDLIFGKRFTLEKYNIQNLVYSPQVGLFYRSHGKDFDDQGVKHGYGFSFQPIKFDLLF